MSVVGVDACKNGWIAVELRDGTPPVAHFLRHIEIVRAAAPEAAVIAIDIPIGLPSADLRQADVAARTQLGPRSRSVFSTPPREVLLAETHALATKLAGELTGKGISQQSWALRSRILEVEEWLPRAPCAVVEVHPEVSFSVMLGHPASASKKTWAGMVERVSALAVAGIHLHEVAGDATTEAGTDDMLDAGAAAWSAARFSAGKAQSFPSVPPLDAIGRAIAIWA